MYERNGAAAEKLAQQVQDADDERYRAMLDHDIAALENLLDDDLVYTHSDARSDGKSEYLEGLRSGRVRYRKATRENVKLIVFGDAALMNGRVVLETTSRGVDRVLNNAFMSMWVRTGGRWRMAAWASTPFPQA